MSYFLYWVPAQVVDATQALKRSAGVSNSSVLRGRPLSFRAIASRYSCECTDKSGSCEGIRNRSDTDALAGQLLRPGTGLRFHAQ